MPMEDDAYPLDHWTAWRQEVPEPVSAAVSQLAHAGGLADERQLADGVSVFPLAGAGNHRVLGLRFDGQSYCLKCPQPTNRHRGLPELVVRREVGGLCTLVDRVPDRCPRPLTWSSSPAWVLASLVPGTHLGNVELTRPQLEELARAYQALYQITPDTVDAPLWPVDWPIAFLLEHMQQQQPLLAEKGRHGAIAAEAASLISDWLSSDGPTSFLASSDRLVFARGDQNMANALWDGSRIRFVDFEYCGWNDMARDLSLVTDHIQSYATPVQAWDWFVDQFDLTPSQRRRLQAGRRRQALSWLAKECLRPGSLHGLPEENRLVALLIRARSLCS